MIHTVPDSGLPTWPSPDPAVPQGPRLDPRLEVDVLSRSGEWAQVRCANGWTAWVDGRLLLTPTPPPPPPPTPATSVESPPAQGQKGDSRAAGLPLGLIVAVAIGLAGLLPWLKLGGATASGFKVPIKFLIDYKTAGKSSLSVGLLLLVIAALGVVFTLRPGMATFARVAGGAAALVATMYVAQMQRLLGSAPKSPGLFSTLGFGVFVTLAGGIALAVLAKRAGTR